VGLKTVYYRGLVTACNYRCSYCAFRRGGIRGEIRGAADDFVADKIALEKFCNALENLFAVSANSEVSASLVSDFAQPSVGTENESLPLYTVMIVPRGEVMIHEYYHDAIAKIVNLPHIHTVGCQTNLSFDVKNFAKKTNTSKISLWCSFHPSQVTLENFLAQCRLLTDCGISYCVGAVASDIPMLKKLRELLPKDVYMWINAKDKNTSNDETFSEIDPYFYLERENFTADPTRCHGGRESIFVEANGDYFACNISKIKLGNIYHTDFQNTPHNLCRAKKCDCYLAYSNRVEMADIFTNPYAVTVRNLQTLSKF
jgi:hypothetical protein